MSGYISDAVIRRMPAYNRNLRELESEGVQQISSQELGERMGLTPSQIRQDINSIGGVGRQGRGYNVRELREYIRHTMGLDQPHRMVILGAGRIGMAVSHYPNFLREGFVTAGLFDSDPEVVARGSETLPVFAVEEIRERIPDMGADIAVIAVPAEAAQETLDLVYELGIRSAWNFAPVDLRVPADMVVVNVHMSDSLHILTYKMNHREE
ncbi:MAG: redox-sensing transcriptional repressor Rex [Clostridia bacterium]|nr:redox-sensing transcriptional repressor Rex [Clostridia bacterium]